MSYTKLFSSILASTIWNEPSETRIVWITMLAMSDRDGNVQASVPGLAHMSRIPLDACQAALLCLLSPDAHSRTKDHEGRRIVEVEGGWLILNYEAHRDRATAEERREKDRMRQQRKRFRDMSRNVTSVTLAHTTSRLVTPSEAEAEADAEASREENQTRAKRSGVSVPDARFASFWEAYGKKVGKLDAERTWRRLAPDDELAARILDAAKAQARLKPDKQFRKDPAGWLRGNCWDDEVVVQSVPGKRPQAMATRVGDDFHIGPQVTTL